jgi:hypothetical protein
MKSEEYARKFILDNGEFESFMFQTIAYADSKASDVSKDSEKYTFPG